MPCVMMSWPIASLGHATDSGLAGSCLTYWGWDKMAAIFQTTFSNFLGWKCTNFIDISIIFVPKGPINNIPSLAQTRPGAKPFSESMQWWLNLLTHIWVTRPWGVNSLNSGKCGTNFKSVLFKLNIENGSLGTHLMNCDLTNATEPH